MSDEIRVYVVGLKGRKNLSMRYTDPDTRRQVSKSTGTHRQREAERVAAKWESEINKKRPGRTPKMSWEYFRDYHEENVVGSIRPATLASYRTTLGLFEELCRPKILSDLKTERVTEFTTKLRRREIQEPTVARHLRSLKVVARWAHSEGLLLDIPVFKMPRRSAASKMKGRPITDKEFKHLLKKVPDVVGEEASKSWCYLLNGLWWSGLRIGEAMDLRWDHRPGGVSVRLDGQHSVLAFDGDSQKSGKVQLVPLSPEAVELIEPSKAQEGFVFDPQKIRGEGSMARHALKIGKVITKIGEKAEIVVDATSGKTASAHDLRRSFGFRWSRLLMPAELKELMRHASIDTTMTYYAGQNARTTAAALWTARKTDLGDTLGDTRPKKKKRKKKKTKKSLQNK